MVQLHRLDGENENQMVYRICSNRDALNLTWDDVANIINESFCKHVSSDTYRKRYEIFCKMYADNKDKFSDLSNVSADFEEKRRELEKEKIKYRDERNAWQKQNRLEARVESILNTLEAELSSIGGGIFVNNSKVQKNCVSDKELIICLSDLHIGQTFQSSFGKYNSTIAKERLQKYADKIVAIAKTHNVKRARVVILGDNISGNIHLSTQVSNNENVIKQVKLASEYIANFIQTLTDSFDFINVSSVSGNHSRLIQDKNLDVKDERLDNLITWTVSKILSSNKKVVVNTSEQDTTVAKFNCCNKIYYIVHGDYDSFTKDKVNGLITMMGEIPYGIICGHRHFPSYNEVNGIQIIQSGSLAGSGDDYTIQTRLCGNPSQTVLVATRDGIECTYNVNL